MCTFELTIFHHLPQTSTLTPIFACPPIQDVIYLKVSIYMICIFSFILGYILNFIIIIVTLAFPSSLLTLYTSCCSRRASSRRDARMRLAGRRSGVMFAAEEDASASSALLLLAVAMLRAEVASDEVRSMISVVVLAMIICFHPERCKGTKGAYWLWIMVTELF